MYVEEVGYTDLLEFASRKLMNDFVVEVNIYRDWVPR